MTGNDALKMYLDSLKKQGIDILLSSDSHNNKYVVNALKGDKIKTEFIDPWVTTSENSEWLLIDRIKKIVEELDA